MSNLIHMMLIHKNPHTTAWGFSSHVPNPGGPGLTNAFLVTIVNKILKQASVFSLGTLNPEMLD